jgi:hypothetical protein
MPVLRTVGDQEQQARCGHALAEAVEHSLCLRIQPVQILDDQQHGLHLTRT